VSGSKSGYPSLTVDVPKRGKIDQAIVDESGRGRVVALQTAYDVVEENRGRDVVVNASYSGVLPARFVGEHAPRGAIGVDCAIGKDGAGIAGLWYLEGQGIPAAAADVATMELGNGIDMFETGVISTVNEQAKSCGVEAGMSVREAARLLLEGEPASHAASDVTNRTVVYESPTGAKIVCVDSIAFGTPQDTEEGNVLLGAGHTGLPAAWYLRNLRLPGFIGSDGGGGKNGAGYGALPAVEDEGIPAATVDANSARMGDGLSTYEDGIVSVANEPARSRGVAVGQSAKEAARILLDAGERT
jgi:hypothetical protein